MTCPFYGKHDTRVAGLISSYGNQCAVVRIAYSPCAMEMAGLPVEWESCRLRLRPACIDRCVGCGASSHVCEFFRCGTDAEGLCHDCLDRAERLAA